MTRFAKRATVHVDGQTIRNLAVYPVEGSDRLRDVEVPLNRVRDIDTVEGMPETVDVEWAGHDYVGEFGAVSDSGAPIYSFQLESDEQRG